MDGFILEVISAFLMYAVALPLAGVLFGLFIKFVLPYCLGGLAAVAAASLAGIEAGLWAMILGIFWALSVWLMRNQHKAIDDTIAWMDGHYRAVFSMLMLGRPYRREKARLQHAQP